MNDIPLYNVDWDEPSGFVELDRYKVPLPKMPALETMENYGLPVEEQKYKRTEIPYSLRRRKQCTPEEEKFIENEYHKIHNGVWMLIGGKPVYFTGAYYFFLTYWTTQKGVKPSFRYTQSLIFLFWEMCVNDPDCYGMFLVKPRRIGGTEMTIEMLWLDAMRYRNMVCGMQSKNEDSVTKNYKRIIKSHKNMIWFMKPINQGSSENKDGLFFKYPVENNSAKKIRDIAQSGEDIETVYEDDEIGSEITYQPSVATAYDGERLDRYILNEFGKVENMSVADCWDKVKPCLHLDNGLVISGKAIFESTIEEIDDKQILEINEFYYGSDYTKRDANNRTETGLFSLFINAIDAAKEDEFGFPLKEQTKTFLENQFEALKAKGKLKELAKLKRKTPIFIEDALTPSGAQSAFNKEKLQEALDRINQSDKEETIRGNFQWENGIQDTRVEFLIDPDGRWEISKLTGFTDNHVILVDGQRYPGNVSLFRCGIDPFSHKETQDNRKSFGASVGFELYDENKDGKKFTVEAGMKTPIDGGKDFLTHQPILVYMYRHDDPDMFFEDMLMQCVFFGMPANPENNKPGIIKYFENRGYGKFIINKPSEIMGQQKTVVPGSPASDLSIEQYFNRISSYIYLYNLAIKHKIIVTQLMTMNRANIGKHDVGVAFGWCLIAVFADIPDFADLYQHRSETEQNEWFDYAEEQY